MSKKMWEFSRLDNDKKELAGMISEEFSLDPFTALLLVSKGITDADEIERFLFNQELYVDPFEIKDMDKAVLRISKAVENFEKIMIFGDYDADGVTSTSLLYLYLAQHGADVHYYIPDRVSEGYGISLSAIEKFREEEVNLIITVDNGISAVEETQKAKEYGIDVIITDHHKVGEQIPDAVAVVNPHRPDDESSFKDYAGVGVAFMLLCALEGDTDAVLDEYSDLAAIGTLADVVPLVGENRTIVKRGIELINQNTRIGIEALKNVSGMGNRELNATSVSFSLAPRINAAGRMSSAMNAMRLLVSENTLNAQDIATQIDEANRERHTVENEITTQAIEFIESHDYVKYAPIIVVSGENWHHGVIGIVASRLVGKYGKPAIVITTDGETAKGSCRSVEGFSIYDALCSVGDMLNHFGGHTLAAGFGIQTKDIDLFRDRLTEYCSNIVMPFPKLKIDFTIKPQLISNDLLVIFSLFEPFGCENLQPCFSIKDMTLVGIDPVGEGKHLRLSLSKDNKKITAMLFSTTIEEFPYCIGDKVDIAFKIEKNEYRGAIHTSIHIQDIRFTDFDYYNCESSVRVYEKFRRGAKLNEKEQKLLTPDRTFFSSVYKFFMAKKSFNFDVETFCHRSGCPYYNAAKVLVTLDVMCELGLLKEVNGKYSLVENVTKVQLESSKILKSIAERG